MQIIKGFVMGWEKSSKAKIKKGQYAIVFRPQAIYKGCYEKPLAIAQYTGQDYTCHIQPTQIYQFEMPEGWTEEHYTYQKY